MKYDLALELYKNGFPQDGIYEDGRENFVIDDDNIPEEDWIIFLNPTLSELIEACGSNFKKLWRHSNGNWTAHAGTKINKDSFQKDGATPEEAVAKLWLVLNKKS